MAISFADAVGNLMNRLGKCGAVIKNLGSYQDTQFTALTGAGGVVGQLNAEPDVQAITGAGYLGALAGTGGAVGALMQSQAAAVVNRMVYRDSPRLGQTLQNYSTLASLQEIIRQMREQGATVRAQTVAATPGAFSGTGDAVLNASVRRPFDGLVLENAFAETVNVRCTADSYTGNATAGNEPLEAAGAGAQSDLFAFDWPLGSNASRTLTLIDGDTDAAAGNLLTNSGFLNFTDDAPDNWEVVTGTPGTNIFQESTLTFTGGSALRFYDETSSVRLHIRQAFADGTAGTASELLPLAQYSACMWMRRGGGVPSAGELEVYLDDGGGNVLLDAAGNQNLFSVDLTALTTSYAPVKGVFRTPRDLPDAVYLNVRYLTPPETEFNIYMDKLGMGGMTQLYAHGPFLAGHSGAVPLVLNDLAQVVVTNGRGAAGTLDTWQTLLYRLFPEVAANELLFPSSASPSISDDLIA